MPASAAAPTPRRDGRTLPLPPSPRGLPLLGQLRAHGRCCHSAWAACPPHSSSAAATEEMMHARDLVFASRPTSANARVPPLHPRRRICALRLSRGTRRVTASSPSGMSWSRIEAATTVDLNELLTKYATTVMSRTALGDESACRLLNDGDSGRRQRKVISKNDRQGKAAFSALSNGS
ncbi:uncharacterized protein [Miscanthus floridulus]|uniref:uncharacterized protein n=1 Tax=Miscanthus floridulus TaxID=154761 RepID=UPI003459791D